MTDAEVAALPAVLRAAQVAEWLSVSTDTVYALAKTEPALAPLMLGRSMRWAKARVARFVAGDGA